LQGCEKSCSASLELALVKHNYQRSLNTALIPRP
jgi:hypothetical protein